MSRMTPVRMACLTAALFVLAGGARAADVTPNDLKQIGLAYHNMADATKKAPARAKDLAPYFENSKKLLDFLESGQIVFYYNVSLRQILAGGAGTSNTVLAHVKEAPTKGGLVLMADGSVRKMTPDEFKKAAKAGKK